MKNTAVVLLVCAILAGMPGQHEQDSPSHEQLLPGSVDGWEPALAAGPNGHIYVVAGKRLGIPGQDKDFEQQQVLWRSEDGGATFEGPQPLTTDGRRQGDQRIAVDASGTVYVSYMDFATDSNGRSITRLRLARSRDGGRTFAVQTVTTHRVTDKPELAISSDGVHVYIVYESTPGPTVVVSHDGGSTWTEPLIIVPSEGRHFWPEALAVAPDGAVWLAVPSMSDSDIAKRKETTVTLHVFRSRDRGRTWQDFEMSRSPRSPNGCPHDQACRVKTPGIGLAVDGRSRAHVVYTEGATAHQPYGLFHQSSSDGVTWSTRQVVSAAPRPQSADSADHHYVTVAASQDERVCTTWVDDRRGALDVWARCSTDAGRSWRAETLLSDRSDGASYKSAAGFKAFFGHYGGAAIVPPGRLHAVWGAGEPGHITGGVWVNNVKVAGGTRR